MDNLVTGDRTVKGELWNIARFPKSIHHTDYKTRLR